MFKYLVLFLLTSKILNTILLATYILELKIFHGYRSKLINGVGIVGFWNENNGVAV
jgi:hypothetical protein